MAILKQDIPGMGVCEFDPARAVIEPTEEGLQELADFAEVIGMGDPLQLWADKNAVRYADELPLTLRTGDDRARARAIVREEAAALLAMADEDEERCRRAGWNGSDAAG